ncbi:hypothetical protein [Streptomyces plumbiresistens]|uniref:hypothetical protein n=1 Tax=Streptomyces plumbiresistens TaxID=511811 RepID=UPI0031EED1F7
MPGWSRAHVVAHVARNADALLNAAPAVVQRWIDAVASGRHPAPPALRLLQVGGARRAPEGARRAEPCSVARSSRCSAGRGAAEVHAFRRPRRHQDRDAGAPHVSSPRCRWPVTSCPRTC